MILAQLYISEKGSTVLVNHKILYSAMIKAQTYPAPILLLVHLCKEYAPVIF
jgi:hypothetical protein